MKTEVAPGGRPPAARPPQKTFKSHPEATNVKQQPPPLFLVIPSPITLTNLLLF